MKNKKSKVRIFTSEILPILGLAVGRETHIYTQKKRTELTLLFLCFALRLETTRHKMVRECDQTSDL